MAWRGGAACGRCGVRWPFRRRPKPGVVNVTNATVPPMDLARMSRLVHTQLAVMRAQETREADQAFTDALVTLTKRGFASFAKTLLAHSEADLDVRLIASHAAKLTNGQRSALSASLEQDAETQRRLRDITDAP